jgi:hypothetical protein
MFDPTTHLPVIAKLLWLLSGLVTLRTGVARIADARRSYRYYKPPLNATTEQRVSLEEAAKTVTWVTVTMQAFSSLFGLFNISASTFALIRSDTLSIVLNPFGVTLLSSLLASLLGYAGYTVHALRRERRKAMRLAKTPDHPVTASQ